jgi:hypothetical protein
MAKKRRKIQKRKNIMVKEDVRKKGVHKEILRRKGRKLETMEKIQRIEGMYAKKCNTKYVQRRKYCK